MSANNNTLDYASGQIAAHPFTRAAEVVLFTAAAVALLVLIQRYGIATIQAYFQLNGGCWQLNVLRSAASASVLIGLLASKRSSFILFGLLYGGTLFTNHSLSWAVPVSAIFAGLGAALVFRVLRGRFTMIWSALGSVLTFNVLLTLGSIYRQLQKSDVATALANYSFDLSIRIVTTLLVFVAALIAWNTFGKKR
jgi:hypothetical protein